MISYFLTFLGGMFVGIVVSCILLAKKNLEKTQTIENNVSNSLSNTWAASKAAYTAEFERLEALNNGGQLPEENTTETTEEEAEEEKAENED